jgi:hypothetical protein
MLETQILTVEFRFGAENYRATFVGGTESPEPRRVEHQQPDTSWLPVMPDVRAHLEPTLTTYRTALAPVFALGTSP